MGRGSFPGWLGGVEVAGESLVMLEGCIVGVFWGDLFFVDIYVELLLLFLGRFLEYVLFLYGSDIYFRSTCDTMSTFEIYCSSLDVLKPCVVPLRAVPFLPCMLCLISSL